jgi:ABC-2 type transport system ATP-binding protein
VELDGGHGPESFLDTLAGLTYVRGVEPREGALVVELDDPHRETPDVVNALVGAGARITGVGEVAATLEEVYLELVGEAGVRDVPAIPEDGA